MLLQKSATVSDRALGEERLRILANLLARAKKDRDDILDQLDLVKNANEELSLYAATFKVDAKLEAANVAKAKDEAVFDETMMAMADELATAEDFAGDGSNAGAVDI